MAIYFLDSSALVKRYVLESGTRWVQGLFDPGRANRIVIAAIGGAEVVAAVARRGLGGSLTAAIASRLIADFRKDFASEFQVVEVLSPIIDSAMRLAERYALRGYDSVQLAAALAFDSIAHATGRATHFVSADVELNAAATVEGLVVENPDHHP